MGRCGDAHDAVEVAEVLDLLEVIYLLEALYLVEGLDLIEALVDEGRVLPPNLWRPAWRRNFPSR